jgi:chromosome partitioning protein
MKTIAIISQKGGAGKTTLALNLAVAANEGGKTVAIIDLDPQASAASWKDLRSEEQPAVVSAQPARLGLSATTVRRSKICCTMAMPSWPVIRGRTGSPVKTA